MLGVECRTHKRVVRKVFVLPVARGDDRIGRSQRRKASTAGAVRPQAPAATGIWSAADIPGYRSEGALGVSGGESLVGSAAAPPAPSAGVPVSESAAGGLGLSSRTSIRCSVLSAL